MLYKVIILIVLLSSTYTLNAQQNQPDTNLRQVFVLFRHGLSTPSTSYPDDPYMTYWNRFGGLGQIESAGLRQSYEFGQFLKNYYSKFLQAIYDPSLVRIDSLDLDRSIMAANVLMSGMYPPASYDQIWSSAVSWFPIPVHSSRLDELFPVSTCPRYDYLRVEQYYSNEYQMLQESYNDFIKNISNFSGIQQLDYLGLRVIAENSIAQLLNNLTLPNWSLSNLKIIFDANDYYEKFNYGSLEVAKLVSGGILNDITKRIRSKMDGSKNEITLYSVDSSHLTALMTLLNISTSNTRPMQVKQPTFNAAVVVELRQDNNGQYYIQVKMKNNTIGESLAFNTTYMLNCNDMRGSLCPLEKFFGLVNGRIVDDLPKKCQDLSEFRTTTPSMPISTYTMTSKQMTTSWNNGSWSTTPNKFVPVECESNVFSRLEIALIIASSVLAAITLLLLIVILVIVRKYKILKTVF